MPKQELALYKRYFLNEENLLLHTYVLCSDWVLTYCAHCISDIEFLKLNNACFMTLF